MKLLFILTVVLGLSLNSRPRVTRRRSVPPSRRQVRRRLRRLRARQLLVALFASPTLQWITRKPRLGRPVRPPTLPTPARPPAFQTARPNGARARASLWRAREFCTASCTARWFCLLLSRAHTSARPARVAHFPWAGRAKRRGRRGGSGWGVGSRLGAGHRPRGAGGSGSRAAPVQTRSRASRRARPAHLGQAATLPPPARS
jgi:hypothetical protein